MTATTSEFEIEKHKTVERHANGLTNFIRDNGEFNQKQLDVIFSATYSVYDHIIDELIRINRENATLKLRLNKVDNGIK